MVSKWTEPIVICDNEFVNEGSLQFTGYQEKVAKGSFFFFVVRLPRLMARSVVEFEVFKASDEKDV